MRYDEDWSPLQDPSKRSDLFDLIKWIPLGPDPSWYLTLGGELRERAEVLRNPLFGLGSVTRDSYLLHRTFLFADVHLGPNLRTFVETVNGVSIGERTPASPTQHDVFDLQQAFADLSFPVAAGEFTIRGGRQEMSFGSSRLVSVRESPNVRRAFDGVRAFWTGAPGTRVDAFVVRPVAPQTGVFNDSSDPTQTFWGIYGTTPISAVKGAAIDVYYLGLDRDRARFAQGTADEHRHTVGSRFFGKQNGLDWDIEGAFQFGSFGSAEIRAWTVASDVGYTFSDAPLTPRLAMKADVASGDHNLHDNRLGTFNALFPKLPYFTEANLVAPSNVMDIQPNITLTLLKGLSVNGAWNPLWKEAKADAYYAPPLSAVRGTTGTRGRYIGQQASASIEWDPDPHITIAATYVHFTPGDLVRQAGGRSGEFAAAWAQFRF
jgi:hypothetical protein